jgi:tetratricopeptide (TPR) repeat protein
LDVLEEALGARVIEELPQAVGRYQFTHALIQETLSEELSLTRRVRLHARIAESLEELYGDSAEAHAAELAHHFSEAEAVLGTSKLVHYSGLAGERALASYAWEEALGHFRRALIAKGVSSTGKEPAADSEEAELLFGLGRALGGTTERLQIQECVDAISRAFDYYFKTGEVDRAVTVAAYAPPLAAGDRLEVARYLGQALELVPVDSLTAGGLLCNYGFELGRVEADYDGAQAAFDRALEIAGKEEDKKLEAQTLAASGNVDYFHRYTRESLTKCRRAIQLARQMDAPIIELDAGLDVLRARLSMGAPVARLKEDAANLLKLAERLQLRYRLALAYRINGNLHRRLGEWERARDFYDRGLAVAPADINLLADLLQMDYELGEFTTGRSSLDRLVELERQAPARVVVVHMIVAGIIPHLSRISGSPDHLELATRAAEIVLSAPNSVALFTVNARTGLALQGVRDGDSGAIAEQYARLQEAGIADQAAGTVHISTGRLLGVLAHASHDFEAAAKHFETIIAGCQEAGYRPELAWTCCDYADTLLQRNASGDRERATSLLDESLAISSELGMRPLMERVLSRREILKA